MSRKHLMPVKEVRALVEKQKDRIKIMELKINSLENDLQSSEGARLSLKTMYDTHTKLTERVIEDKLRAQASTASVQRKYDWLVTYFKSQKDQVLIADRTTAFQHFILGFKKLIKPTLGWLKDVSKSLSFFRNRTK